MEFTIAERIKSRNKQRLNEVEKKRKKMEAEEAAKFSSQKRRKRESFCYDSDLEDLTPFHNNDNINNGVSEESGKNSSGLKNGFEEDKAENEIRALVEKKPELGYIEISSNSDSDSDSASKEKASSEMKSILGDSVGEDESESEDDSSDDKNFEDSLKSDSESAKNLPSSSSSLSLSSPSSSSSSDDEEFSSNDDSSVRKVSRVVRKPLKRYKKAETFRVTKPRKDAIDEKKKQKMNSKGHEEEEEAERRVRQKPSNRVYLCAQCGNEKPGISDSNSSFIRAHNRRDENEDMNQFASNNVSRYEDSVSINSTTEELSKPENKNSEKEKEEKTPENSHRAEVENSETSKEVKAPVFLSSGAETGILKTGKRLETTELQQSRPETENSEAGKVVKTTEFQKFRPETENSDTMKVVKTSDFQQSRPETENSETTKVVKTPDYQPFRHQTESSDTMKVIKTTEFQKFRPETENSDTMKVIKTTDFQQFRPETENSETTEVVKTPDYQPFRHQIENSKTRKEVQVPEKPSTCEKEIAEKAREVQAKSSLGLKLPAVAERVHNSGLVNEVIDEEVASLRFANKPRNESVPSQKEKNMTFNNKSRSTDLDVFRLLVNSIWDQDGSDEEDELFSSPKDQSQVEQGNEDERKYDDDGLLIIRQPPPIVNWLFGQEEPETPPEPSESEIDANRMWEEMEFCLKSSEIDKEEASPVESPTKPGPECNHDFRLDLEIGLKCINCSYVVMDIQSMDVSEWGDMNTNRRRKIDRYEEERNSLTGEFEFEAPSKNGLNGCDALAGTVWDKIPGIKSQLYPHQKEGFEFIWRNLAGTIVLNELKNFENSDETGGCIMSHAPGTGKTRLTITFLKSYLECFPDCKPVIIAPASLLLTWAEEFKKWNTCIPFHNLNSLEFSGRESLMAVKLFEQKSSRGNLETRMVKLYSWIKGKSILGVSYSLYEMLAGEKIEKTKRNKVREMKPSKELEQIRKILLEVPGLLVLDEAHTPRNQRSCIWQTLSKLGTQKRILLSGTPFQNNFLELNNVLGLARPNYVEMLSSTLKKNMMTVTKRTRKGLGDSENDINRHAIEELKTVMLPFVHVHKGSILQKSLPGLRDCVVVLNPPEMQKRVLEAIEVSQTVFEVEYKQALVSIHPSLVSTCAISEKERLVLNEAFLAQLQKIKFDPNQSVKTRFLMEFISLCNVINEKVLVFSQYVKPLLLIKKQLESRFEWREEDEVLCMYGKVGQKQRQTLINTFNDHKSKAKVFLASTKACSEGINLVGASRVILLDVVWNPAVERQAISRAYRIGQQRMVYTYHLVIKGTPDCHKFYKQAEKHRLSELVFASSSRKGKEKIEAVTEDKLLDSLVQHVKLGEMFEKIIYQPKEADLVEGFSLLMP